VCVVFLKTYLITPSTTEFTRSRVPTLCDNLDSSHHTVRSSFLRALNPQPLGDTVTSGFPHRLVSCLSCVTEFTLVGLLPILCCLGTVLFCCQVLAALLLLTGKRLLLFPVALSCCMSLALITAPPVPYNSPTHC
jgi:hypothetical protein